MSFRSIFYVWSSPWIAFGLSLLLLGALRAIHVPGNFIEHIDDAVSQDGRAELLVRQQGCGEFLPFSRNLLDISFTVVSRERRSVYVSIS
jgi:hypothetical protein